MSTESIPYEIRKKYIETREFKSDPFPEIPSALLNSAHIKKYIMATGMVEPFNLEDLKIASLKGRIAGDYKYWEVNDNNEIEFVEGCLKKKGDYFTLKKNAIAYVGISTFFQLPDYIAVRFNLRRRHAYKGLLLGTGPLVDPGYRGRIYIPLHNLTSNDYDFYFDDDLIEFEFTKTSIPCIDKFEKSVPYKTQLFDSKILSLNYFIRAAVGPSSVVSSIPDAFYEAKEESKKVMERFNSYRNLAIVGILGVIATVSVGLIPVYLDLQNELREIRRENYKLSLEVQELKLDIAAREENN